MPTLLKNNAYSTLSGSFSNVATSLSLQAGQGARFPSPAAGTEWFYITLQDSANNIEIVCIVARTTDTLTVGLPGSASPNVAGRGQESTTARSWVANDVVELRLTAGLVVTPDGSQTLTNKTLSTGNTVSGELLNTATSSLQVPSGTTAQRPSNATGKIRFNTESAQYEGYNGTGWSSLGGAQAGGAIYENKQSVASSYTITTGSNAFSVGPLSVAGGAAVTVPSGSRWVVL